MDGVGDLLNNIAYFFFLSPDACIKKKKKKGEAVDGREGKITFIILFGACHSETRILMKIVVEEELSWRTWRTEYHTLYTELHRHNVLYKLII